MKHFEYTHNAFDSLPLYFQGWEPEIEPQAAVCLVHGLGEHSGRYVHVADFMTQEGIAVLSFDLRGHGKSGGARGHSPSIEAFMKDIDLLMAEAGKRYGNKPLFMYGHSLGGMLTLYYGLSRKPQLAGVVVTGPGLRTPLGEQTFKVTLSKVLGSLLPAMSMPSGLDPHTISRDPAVVQAYIDDPLVHDQTSLAMAKSSFEAIDWIFKHASEFSLPLLIMHGSEDKLVYPRGSEEFASLVKGDCTLKIWEGLAHEVHNDPEKDQVLEYAMSWLKSRLR